MNFKENKVIKILAKIITKKDNFFLNIQYKLNKGNKHNSDKKKEAFFLLKIIFKVGHKFNLLA
jgi:hypothetical protein